MGRTIKNKELINTRLATNYGGWMYCDKCNENIGYLCYSTYDNLTLNYECKCGSKGSIHINFEDSKIGEKTDKELITIKNRFCCSKDEEPLITILEKKVNSYNLEVTCKACQNIYKRKF